MSYIQSTIRCKDCGHAMNVATGMVGTMIIGGLPSKCPKCGSLARNYTKVADGWQAEQLNPTPDAPELNVQQEIIKLRAEFELLRAEIRDMLRVRKKSS